MLASVPSTGIFFHFLCHFYRMPCSVLIHAYFWDHTWPCTLLCHWNVNGRLLRSGSNAFFLALSHYRTGNVQSRLCRPSWDENKKRYCVKPHSTSKRHTWYEWERKVLFLTQRYWEYLLQMLASLRVHGRASRWKQRTFGPLSSEAKVWG